MRWEKLGVVFAPSGELPWARSHAYVPTPWRIPDGPLRVYFAGWDAESVGRVGFVDLDPEDPRRVLRVAREPALDVGEPGTFDEWGVTPISIVSVGNRLRLYYLGWQRTRGGRYTMLTGVAESADGERFERLQKVPVLERGPVELFARSAACVMPEGEGYRAWYVAGSRWIEVDGKERPTYGLRTLASEDGVRWGPEGEVCFDPEGDDEFGFGRPWVWKEGGGYRMIYSVRTRSRGYRLGYAESADGRRWIRQDDRMGLEPSADGWDSEMVAFAARVVLPSETYLLYNGNGFGRTGFGLARERA